MQHYLKLQQNNACEGPQQHKRLSCRILFALLIFLPTLGWAQTDIDALSSITDMAGHYRLTANVSGAGHTTITGPFTGTLEAAIDPATKMPYRITDLDAPLFTTLSGTVKNLVLENVSISQAGQVGAIASVANGSARVYNVGILSGSVGSTGTSSANNSTDCCGGLVGLLDGSARVINCYSYANITGGNRVGGIVGYNGFSTTSVTANLKTMVMNCMFYGDITGGSNKAPIYNGNNISNKDASGVSNFNYVRAEASFVQKRQINTANCALLAETRFLQRFEFFRQLLNGHRELAGWWATGTYSSSEMHKWVMIPDSIGTSHPYPVLKEWGRYPSVVNYDAENALENQPRNKGGKLGTLSVTVQIGSGGAVYGPAAGAEITTSSLSLNILDKDPDHFNFNYYKVQLPYYNDVGSNNYRKASDGKSRVVTGWKIVSITGGTPGTYSAGEDATVDDNGNITSTPYNFADRKCTNKDLYSVSGRVFNQGSYWDVPEGVTAITIEPYWARCTYLADAYADVVYNQAMETKYDVPNVGGGSIYTDNSSYTIAGENQVVRTTFVNAVSTLFDGVAENTSNDQNVYDYAIVLIGNTHSIGVSSNNTKRPYTIMSIDADHDNEPDYSYILRFNGRTPVHPVRVDFINIPGLGMAQKSTGGSGSYNFGILQPKGFFESTNTSLFRVTQFEYDAGRDVTKPYIVQGGVMEQWVGGQQTEHKNKITYFHVGGNVWFKEFHRGCHQDKTWTTKHPPVSVTGGDYDEFYLTGLYRGDVANYEDNAECYINGGRFGIVCGTAMEGIGKANGADNTGNITWQIQNADIREFYAGGLNAASGHTVTGNISTTITGGYIEQYCGGSKFGDMSSGKTVTTNATDCTFGTFFGAGYGGNSYSRYAPNNQNNVTNINWNNWVTGQYTQTYSSTYGGVSTQFNYQFLPMSDNKTNVARLFVEYVKFSLATSHTVTSNLTNCIITGNFYGGGNLGKVDNQVSSVLESCIVKGNVYGAGQAATLPTVEVDSIGFRVEPYYYTDFGTYRIGVKGETTPYKWEHGNAISIDIDNQILYTTENLNKDNLGSVKTVSLTIKGNTTVGTEGDSTTGNVYGGGDESAVSGNTTVNLQGNAHVRGSVYGGGNMGIVGGNTSVTLQGNTEIHGNVYGGGNQGFVSGDSSVIIQDP